MLKHDCAGGWSVYGTPAVLSFGLSPIPYEPAVSIGLYIYIYVYLSRDRVPHDPIPYEPTVSIGLRA